MIQQQPLNRYFLDPLWKNNQIIIATLGICSALAVTTRVQVALTMALAVSFVTACSSFFISTIRRFTPDNVRMVTQLAIISTFVIIVDQFIKAYFFEISKQLSVFVGLIITNCLVMGRAEAMARHVSPVPATLDGLAAGLGYGAVLVVIAGVRELLGFGELWNITIIPHEWYYDANHPDGYQNFGLAPLAPMAFFLIAGCIWISNIIKERQSNVAR